MKDDRFSALPDSLITQILLCLPTKDSVRTSLYRPDGEISGLILKEWVATAIDCGIENLNIEIKNVMYSRYYMPMNIYKSKTLVSLKLAKVELENPEFVVSLPCLKIMHLEDIFHNLNGLLNTEKLILGCLVLEDLNLVSSHYDDVRTPAPLLRVRSHTLKIFRLKCHPGMCENHYGAEIDAPRLKYMSVKDNHSDRIVVKNLSSLFKIDIDTNFNVNFAHSPLRADDLTKRDIIHDFLTGISTVRHMIISQHNLKVLYRYSKLEPIPKFHNLSHLQVAFSSSMLQLFPIFLGSCPNLKKLIVNFSVSKEPDQQIDVNYVPRCLSSTLDCVEINKLITWEKTGMKLVRYIVENSVVLMKLNLSFTNPVEDLDIYEELLTAIKRSRRCRVNLFH
ncbi:LOW QUALITY PROTEIN: putative F-box/FBD/LRR-repeat protein At5g44950 [Eutrema salsugineum]|uniref:LOW QUALITY PROTEIN: putative F-box/FBD/LRR-repeat protein At5g44950 n=1 Tax=Eutrema salsugineum TaxID=72664 RepID=UPI000CECF08F|nr:LOW QUALITY PROTEIN: putative F-box/FBD/LRR-repeat protein At5g44950 [Eutrema salsugineum]